jgi:uncharacterized surface protein with fasciclin (FAS1) repeats
MKNVIQKIKPMKAIKILTILITAASLIGAAQAQTKPGNIVAVVSGAPNVKTLLAAVKSAGLVETLQGTGPFTVFAPTDAAFAKLPKATLDDLLKPENKEKLASILTYHVVAGNILAADIKSGKVKTVNGKELDIKVADGVVTVDGAKVITADIPASNGTIHLIDTVVMP